MYSAYKLTFCHILSAAEELEFYTHLTHYHIHGTIFLAEKYVKHLRNVEEWKEQNIVIITIKMKSILHISQ